MLDDREPQWDDGTSVDEVMTPEPRRVTTEDNVQEAAWIMRDVDCGSVPVVDHSGRLAGMLTDRDIVLRVVCEGFRGDEVKVGDVMTHEVHSLRTGEPASRVTAMMKEHQIRRVPVVDQGDRLVGIVAVADIAQATDETEELGETVEEISTDREN